jgi:hypothetical protein
MLATTLRLAQGGQPGSPLALHNMIFTNIFILLNYFHLTSSKYLPECIKSISMFSYMQSPHYPHSATSYLFIYFPPTAIF